MRLPLRAVSLSLGVSASVFSAASSFAADTPPPPAFPGAVGFGADATGGRGGEVVHVTTLADAGPGSFRDAVSKGKRMVVFDVGGIVALKSNVEVASDTTIAGQTAPGEGICFYGAGVSLSGKTNIVVRHLRFRGGMASDRGKKSLGMSEASRIVVDHCSIQWGRWDNLGITVKSHDITVQDCLIAEAIHPQSFGAIIDSVSNVSLVRNLWMSNESRNPKAKGTIQYINNVVYNWGGTGLCGGHSAADHFLDVIGNTFVKGPSSSNKFAGQFSSTDHLYLADNWIDLDRDGKSNAKPAGRAEFLEANGVKVDEVKSSSPTFVDAPSMKPAIPVNVLPAAEAAKKVAAGAGASLRRDGVDRRLIEEFSSFGQKGATIPHTDERGEALVGGIGKIEGGEAPADTDRDGIPDAWEIAHKLDPKNPADGAELDASGYSRLEIYLNSLVGGAPRG